jgi:hypothetical protein
VEVREREGPAVLPNPKKRFTHAQNVARDQERESQNTCYCRRASLCRHSPDLGARCLALWRARVSGLLLAARERVCMQESES